MTDMSSLIRAMDIALSKGYRVLEDGTLLGTKGKPLKVKRRGAQRYPTFSVNVGDLTESGVYGIPAHKFAAYVFYGEDTFGEGVVVRHLNGDTEDISKANIVLGTHSENNLDKDPEVRRAAARKARAAQGKRPPNARFSEEQVIEIRERRAAGENGYRLAEEFGVTPQAIYYIEKGRNYR